MNGLFADMVGPFEGPRLGYKPEGNGSDFVYRAGISGRLSEVAAALDGEGGVRPLQGGGYRKKKLARSTRRSKRRSTRRLRR